MKILVVCPTIYPEKLKEMTYSLDITKSKDTDLAISSEGTVTKSINDIFNNNQGYDFYFIANDDIIFHTPLWDKKLANKGKISYGNDLLQGNNLCTFPMIDGDIVRALGWLQLPTLDKYCGDNVWKVIGDELNILEYYGNVFIKHKWKGGDDIKLKEDMKKFSEWLPKSHIDINKIKKALTNVGI